MSTAIAIDKLTKRYGKRTVLDNMVAEVPAGAVAGFIGPNGAGKTTTMAILTGLVQRTSGNAHVLGHPIDESQRYISRVGALLEGPAMWTSLSGRKNLEVLAKLGGHDKRAVPQLLDTVGLGDRGNDRFGRFSLGMKQRLGIAAALLGDPELVILDEPINGLDPAGIRDIRKIIQEMSGERTIFISSHILSELEHVCDWLVIVDVGRVRYCGPTDSFVNNGARQIELTAAEADDVVRLQTVAGKLGFTARADDGLVVIDANEADARSIAAAVNRSASQAGIDLVGIRIASPSLEARYYGTLNEGQQ